MIPALTTARLTQHMPAVAGSEPNAAFCAWDRAAFIGGPGNRSEAWRARPRGAGMTGAPWEIPPTGPTAAIAARLAAATPELATLRLRLRAPRLEDFATYARIVGGPAGAHVGGPFEREEAWLDFAQMVAGWMLRGAGLWSVERRADGALIGFLPLSHEFGDPEIEIGWFLAPEAEGQGYAGEAAEAALRFAFLRLGLPTLVSYIDAANDRSLRLAERLGARPDPAPHPGDPDVRVYRHTAPEGRE